MPYLSEVAEEESVPHDEEEDHENPAKQAFRLSFVLRVSEESQLEKKGQKNSIRELL